MSTYFVATDGNDAAAGSYAAPVATINHGIDLASSAGDILYVRSGTYDERVTIDNSGSAVGGYISIVGYPFDATKPICRGFDATSKEYVRIAGVEVTHTANTWNNAVILAACNHIEILNNYFHNTNAGRGAINWYDSECTYITIRDNHFYLNGYVEGVYDDGNSPAVQCRYGDHILIEYNHGHRIGDFVLAHGHDIIIRNNYWHDYADTYFPGLAADALHCDFFQGSMATAAGYPLYNLLHESNVLTDNIEANSHGFLIQHDSNDANQADDWHDDIMRGNVVYNLGSQIIEHTGIDNGKHYANSFASTAQHEGSGSTPMWYRGYDADDPSIGNLNRNNLYLNIPFSSGSALVTAAAPNVLTVDHNWAHNTTNTTGAGSVGTDDPLLVNEASDWHLQAGSPLIDAGAAITLVNSADGSGTEFDVDDASVFCDGYGIAEGDLIAVGTGDPVRITDVTTDTITVASSISWTQGDGVYWRTKQALDIGAYEYRAGGYAYDVTLSVASNGVITATPTVPALVRDVEFWIDGLPVERKYDGPYTYAWNLAGLSGQHFIEVRAHALYADPDLWQSADRTVTVTDGAVVAGEGDLYEVTYEANGAVSGSVPTDTTDYAETDPVTVIGNTGALARTGYYFRGWNTAADGSGTHYAPGATFEMPAENEMLYAEWHTLFAWVKG